MSKATIKAEKIAQENLKLAKIVGKLINLSYQVRKTLLRVTQV